MEIKIEEGFVSMGVVVSLVTIALGNAHEKSNQEDAAQCGDTQQDLHNNDVGAQLGENKGVFESCADLVLDALSDGKLQTNCPGIN